MTSPRAAARTAVVGAIALAAACGAPGNQRSVETTPGAATDTLPVPDTVTGTVRQAGNVPFVRTLVEGDDTVTVTGPVEEEISRLSGARVRVAGRVESGGAYPGRTLVAAGYEILSVDGERPEVGTLRRGPDGYYLERPGSEPLPLSAVSAGLQRLVGARVWVVTGTREAVRRYGVLKPAP